MARAPMPPAAMSGGDGATEPRPTPRGMAAAATTATAAYGRARAPPRAPRAGGPGGRGAWVAVGVAALPRSQHGRFGPRGPAVHGAGHVVPVGRRSGRR